MSNCSIWLFDEKNASKFPTFGYKLLEKDHNITGPISFAKEMLYTMLETHDNEPQEYYNTVRTITISSKGTIRWLLTCREKINRKCSGPSGRERGSFLINEILYSIRAGFGLQQKFKSIKSIGVMIEIDM